jgi:hypothetical protein
MNDVQHSEPPGLPLPDDRLADKTLFHGLVFMMVL